MLFLHHFEKNRPRLGSACGISDRVGIYFAHAADASTAHKWTAIAWRDAEAAASDATVYMGDKKKGKEHYSQFCSSYVPDVVTIHEDGVDLAEIKNYSPFVHAATTKPAVTTLNGHTHGFGNTEERLKHRVLGSRRRGTRSDGKYDHRNGTGHVPAHDGDYVDAIKNRKAKVHLLVHETTGGISPFAARRLRRLARAAAENDNDTTDYTLSSTARAFVPYYSQRICTAIRMHGAHCPKPEFREFFLEIWAGGRK